MAKPEAMILILQGRSDRGIVCAGQEVVGGGGS